MARENDRQFERGMIELLEEACHLLRRGPAGALAGYYVGSLPFVLALLYFWSDMSRSAFAAGHLTAGAFGVAAAFVWMKCWQTAFARQLLAQLCGEAPPRWTLARTIRMAATQAAIQPWALPLLPLILLVPWVNAFFQNASILGDGDRSAGMGAVIARSARQASLWSRQNFAVRLVLLFFAVFVFTNLSQAVTWPAHALKAFLGIETPFSRGGFIEFNSTFLAIVLCATYLCVGPVAKAYYTLRCFYGLSLQTGQDLQADLKRLAGRRRSARGAAVIVLCLLIPAAWPASAPAQPARGATPSAGPSKTRAVTADKLDRSIRKVIGRREYTWRMPRRTKPKVRSDSALRSVLEAVVERIRKFFAWLGRRSPSAPRWGWLALGPIVKIVILAALALAVAGLIYLIAKAVLNRSGVRAAKPVPAAAAAGPDVADENVSADEMPEDGWLEMARDLLGKGDRRLALRAMYLASLSMLAARELIVIARFKSNREYHAELARRSHALPGLSSAFARNVTFFEDAWYGMHDVTDRIVHSFMANQERIRSLGEI